MQVIILAAGISSRFYPFNTTHKSCIKLLDKTIIEHTVLSIKKFGITDIILVVSNDGKIKDVLKDGKALGVSITYVIQEDALGAGDALLRAKSYITGDFFITWANRVEFAELATQLKEANEAGQGAVLLKKTDKLEGIGVVTVQGDRLDTIIEKPDVNHAPSNLKIVGLYLLPQNFIATLENTPVEHYSFEKALVSYAKDHIVRAVVTASETVSLKYPWDLLQMKNYLLQDIVSYKGNNVSLADNVVITGKVYIDDGVKIMENAVIKGPCYIGKNAYIGTNAILRNGVVIEKAVVVGANMEVKNSILFKDTTTHAGFIGDSIIGEGCKLAAYFCTANVRLDRQEIEVLAKESHTNSHLTSLGVIMGDEVKVGIRVSTMPGVVIGHRVVIGPQTIVMKNVQDNTKYYTRVQEVIEKKV